ncbi:MAG: glucan biosynthesis protein [Opitutaceae bacterium]
MPAHLKILPAALFATVACALADAAIEQIDVTHQYVAERASELASQPYDDDPPNLPKSLDELTYDDYRRIRFVPEESLWRGDASPFQVQFFHPGYIFKWTVALNEFTDGYVQRIPFLRTFFDYQDLRIPGRLPGDLDYAGFKVLYPFKDPGRLDEVVSFLGASYFRAVGRDHTYGLSARGLAINSGGPELEEFPRFVEFWLGKPPGGATELTVHALLDSHSVTGAYTFRVVPGEATVTEVHATLFFRRVPDVAGYAPITSMFWYGENSHSQHGDFRPEVHDSDGLLVAVGEERTWRPIFNPPSTRLTDFPAENLRGFGLLQRDRLFYSYQDMEAHYQDRPSLWMEPMGQWPAGKVRLVELHSENEYGDNMVAFFVPENPPELERPLELRYRLHWTSAGTFGGPRGIVGHTRQSVRDAHAGKTMFVVDFSTAGMEQYPADADIQPEVKVEGPAAVERVEVRRNEVDGTWRLTLWLAATERGGVVTTTARLVLGGAPISEYISLPWNP